MTHPKTVIFYGMTGAGKGTQAKLLVEDFKKRDTERDTLYIETGQKFREFMDMPFYTAALVKGSLQEGGLLPEYLPIWLWSDILIRHFDGSQHLILDGLARRLPEAPVLDGALRFYKREKPTVVVLNVPKELVLDRLKKRDRGDDTAEHVKAKVDWFETHVMPTINYFREQKDYYTVLDIDGSRDVTAVQSDIQKAIFG